MGHTLHKLAEGRLAIVHAKREPRAYGRYHSQPVLAGICLGCPNYGSKDRDIKFKDYAAHGVGEYWIVDPDLEMVEQHVLREGEYELVAKAGEGVLVSTLVSGFEIPVRAIFDAEENLSALRQILG